MPAIGYAGEVVEARPEVVLFYEYGLYSGEQASFRVVDLGQSSKEGEVVDKVVLRPCLAH